MIRGEQKWNLIQHGRVHVLLSPQLNSQGQLLAIRRPVGTPLGLHLADDTCRTPRRSESFNRAVATDQLRAGPPTHPRG